MASGSRSEQGNGASGGPATATSINEALRTASAKDPFIGRILSHYRLEERVGAGGMGLLYRATDLTLGRAVAIKLLARDLVTDETAKARFIQEARAASALDHRDRSASIRPGHRCAMIHASENWRNSSAIDVSVPEIWRCARYFGCWVMRR